MHIPFSKKDIAVMVVLLSHSGSDSDYWKSLEEGDLPNVMLENGIKTTKEAENICDNLLQRLNIDLKC